MNKLLSTDALGLLNEVVWHSWGSTRLSDELNKMGITDQAIDDFLVDYKQGVERALSRMRGIV
jgi:SOS response regulatory protein OraA/RecX